jgi:hypothetical protein
MTGPSCLVRSVTLGGGLPGWTPEFNRRMVFPHNNTSLLNSHGTFNDVRAKSIYLSCCALASRLSNRWDCGAWDIVGMKKKYE